MTQLASADVAGFWRWFSQEADNLAEVVSGRSQGNLTAALDSALTRFGLPLTYEVSANAHGPELIFAAEGDPQRTEFLKRMVERAPTTQWSIHAERPRRTLDGALQIVSAVYGVELRDARFQVRVVDGRFHLRFLDDALFAQAERRRHDVAALFLDYALGESVATAMVAGLDFQPSGDGIAMPLMVNELIRKAQRQTAAVNESA